ncbi:MAG: hypothetical protein ABEI74_04790 [Candidatus Pacearchaeota archaeon]
MTDFAETHMARFYPQLLEEDSPHENCGDTRAHQQRPRVSSEAGHVSNLKRGASADTHSPEELNTTAFWYPCRISNFQNSSGKEAESESESSITAFHTTYSASDYQEEDLDGQTLVDSVETRIVWK